MGLIKRMLLSGLVAFSLNCAATNIAKEEREVILHDDHMAYKLAFPDTTFLDLIGERFKVISNEKDERVVILERFFDRNFNMFPDLVVFYQVKKFNDITGEYLIDSTKAPLAIITNNESGNVFIHMYNPKNRKYERHVLQSRK